MRHSVTFVHQEVGPPKLLSSTQSLESILFHPSRKGNVLCSHFPVGARSHPRLGPSLLCLRGLGSHQAMLCRGLCLPSRAVPRELVLLTDVCSVVLQAQHLPPGVHGPAGAHVPAQHPRPQAALPALRHGTVVQRGYWWGRPGEQHPPDPLHHSHCALRPEHVSISAPWAEASWSSCAPLPNKVSTSGQPRAVSLDCLLSRGEQELGEARPPDFLSFHCPLASSPHGTRSSWVREAVGQS